MIKVTATAFAVMAVTIALHSRQVPRMASEAQGTRAPVLVELFTSEGCSSCPPADELLIRLEKEQPVSEAEVIVVGQHVTYWNSPGWVDRFSSEEFTRRQQDYANAFQNDTVYTPQMIVDGVAELVGNNASAALATIRRASREAKGRVEITPLGMDKNELRLRIRAERPVASSGRPSGEADIFLVITETNLSSVIAGGENSGRTIRHTGVARWLRKAGKFDKHATERTLEVPARIGAEWRRENLYLVVFIQERETRRVFGATQLRLFP